MNPHIRGLTWSAVVAAFALKFAQLKGVQIDISLIIPWGIVAAIPWVMSVIFSAPEERYRNDFRGGMWWYGITVFIMAPYQALGHDSAQPHGAGGWAWLILIPGSLCFFAFGVIQSHSTLTDKFSGGSFATLRGLKHPRLGLLKYLLFGGGRGGHHRDHGPGIYQCIIQY